MMNCEASFCIASVCGRCLSVGLLRIRGELAIGVHLRATDLYTVGSFDPDHDAVMRIGGKAPGGGPILSVGIKCQVRIRLPATWDRQFGSHAEKPVRAPNGAEWSARSGKPFHVAGRKTTPSNGSPVVTKRQSAMISLRASATIIVLRVPLRLSAVRARYHNVSALSFWNIRKRPASWIMPRRTRAVPALGGPLSRRGA